MKSLPINAIIATHHRVIHKPAVPGVLLQGALLQPDNGRLFHYGLVIPCGDGRKACTPETSRLSRF